MPNMPAPRLPALPQNVTSLCSALSGYFLRRRDLLSHFPSAHRATRAWPFEFVNQSGWWVSARPPPVISCSAVCATDRASQKKAAGEPTAFLRSCRGIGAQLRCRPRQPRSQELTRHSVQQRNVFRPCRVRYRALSPQIEGRLLAGDRSDGAMIPPLRLRPLLAGTCPSTTSPRGHPEPPSKDLESIWTTWRYRVRGSPSATAPLCRFPG